MSQLNDTYIRLYNVDNSITMWVPRVILSWQQVEALARLMPSIQLTLQTLQHALQQKVPGARLYANQPDITSLKSKINQLYHRVHPDRFHHSPIALESNEKSFKLLQEYLSAAKTGGGIGRTAGLPYHFVFYIQKEAGEQAAEGGASADAATEGGWSQHGVEAVGVSREGGGDGVDGEASDPMDGLKKVEVTLPPPVRHCWDV
jgi:hypothetical protein